MRRLLGDWLGAWHEYVKDTETPYLFRTWAGLFAICAATSRRVYQKYSMIKFPMNLWVLFVAPPGRCRKSSILEPVKWLIKSIPNAYLGSEMTTPEALIEQFVDAYKYACERLNPIEVMETAPSALTIVSSEFGVFLGDNPKFLNILTDLYDCPDDWDYKTVGKPNARTLRRVWLSILAATTPDSLAHALPKTASEGGFLSRFIICFAAKPSQLVALTDMPEEDEELKRKLLKDLEVISEVEGLMVLDHQASDYYRHWYMNEHSTKEWEGPFLSHYAARRPRHLLTVAGLFSLSRTTDKIITMEDMGKALRLLEATEETMMQWSGDAGEEPHSSCRARIKSHLTIHGGELPRDKLVKAVGGAFAIDTIDKTLQTMMAGGELEIVNRDGQTVFKLINSR